MQVCRDSLRSYIRPIGLKKLDSLDDIESVFEEVIRINEWSSTDRVSASPDNGDDSIIYINGTVYWYLEDDV